MNETIYQAKQPDRLAKLNRIDVHLRHLIQCGTAELAYVNEDRL